MSILEVKNVGKRFGGLQALSDVNLSVAENSVHAIIGPNGAGKSTVMKIIAGLDEAFQGDVVWADGYTVGYLSQEPELDESKTVREIVEEGTQEIVDVLNEYEEIRPEHLREAAAVIDARDGLMRRKRNKVLFARGYH